MADYYEQFKRDGVEVTQRGGQIDEEGRYIAPTAGNDPVVQALGVDVGSKSQKMVQPRAQAVPQAGEGRPLGPSEDQQAGQPQTTPSSQVPQPTEPLRVFFDLKEKGAVECRARFVSESADRLLVIIGYDKDAEMKYFPPALPQAATLDLAVSKAGQEPVVYRNLISFGNIAVPEFGALCCILVNGEKLTEVLESV